MHLLSIGVSLHGRPQKFFQGGKRRDFFYPFQVAVYAVTYAENFHGGSFSAIWWSFVFGVFVTS